MKHIRIILAAALFLAATALPYAQEPGQEPKKEEQRPELPERNVPPSRQEEPKAQKQEKQEVPKAPKENKSAEGKNQGHARPAGKSAHIPDPKFKTNFGRQHTFAVKRVLTTTTVVAGQTQFVYGGYTFIFLDPWPSAWLFTDDCYIDFIGDEYVLVDVLHPGIYVTLFVVG